MREYVPLSGIPLSLYYTIGPGFRAGRGTMLGVMQCA
jgi:hypothetical protein